ncbi:MAG: hypothetical protein KF754_15585 [Planctomycetes bacterium]|nr:hypothetical protein [Planctomycetota bacterium]
MRILLLMFVLSSPLAAMDAEAARFARRVLLHESARKHLGIEVGDIASVRECTLVRGDFNGDAVPDVAALVSRDGAWALALFDGSAKGDSPAGVHLFRQQNAVAAERLALSGHDAIGLDTTESTDDGHTQQTTVRTTVLRWHQNGWVRGLEFVRTLKRTSGRVSRIEATSLEHAAGRLSLVGSGHDLLDGQELANSRFSHHTPLTIACDGSLTSGATTRHDVPVPTRTQLARTLEREGLLAAALEQSQLAVRQADADLLPADDARRLDAKALHQRLAASLASATVGKR